MSSATNTSCQKHISTLRYFFLGRNFIKASEALELGQQIHRGFRADKVTPEFQHQLEITQYLRSLESCLVSKEEAYCAALLHDAYEDYPEIISIEDINNRFGKLVSDSVKALSKPSTFNKEDQSEYFDVIALNAIASVVKAIDRINNIDSMVGVFSKQKQLRYIKEVEDYFFPMLKKARRAFPSQETIYENLKYVLNSQITLIKEIHRNETIVS